MTSWTIAIDRECCGYCGKSIGAGRPMQVIEIFGVTRKRLRCVDHRMFGTEVDYEQVDAATKSFEERKLDLAPMRISAYRPQVVERPMTRDRRQSERAFTSLRSIAQQLPVLDAKSRAAGDE